MTVVRIPVTLELACALEDCGNLFAQAEQLVALGDAGLGICARLLADTLSPLMTLGAVTQEADGQKVIDRQAVIDFATVMCGYSRSDAWQWVTLHELALHAQRLGVAGGIAARPDAAFMTAMLEKGNIR